MKRALRGIVSEIVPNGPLNRAAVRQRGFLETISAYFSGEMRARIRAENLRWVSPSRSWKTRQVNPQLPRATISFEQKEIEAACHGVDQRHPFADRDFVDFMVALPCETKADPVRAKSLMVEALGDDLPGEIRQRPKSDYVAVLRHRVDPRRCIEVVRASGIELPDVDYRRLFEQADADPGAIPIFLLVNLARVHRFAQRAR